MVMRDSYLYPTLEAGSSRVFNVSRHTSQLLQSETSDDQAPKLGPLFKSDALNKSIIVKETRPNKKTAHGKKVNPVGTKIYFPFDTENIYDGGRSLFVDEKNIELLLREHFGVGFKDDQDEANNDIYILRALEELPSLDPFLIRDKFDIEGIKANEAYYDISEPEWKEIRTHVSGELKPIITFAFQDTAELERGRTLTLLNKLWNTKDIKELDPIIKAFGIPEDEASVIFSAWKGIMYYEYEYSRCLPDWREYFQWLQYDAQASDFVDPNGKALIESSISNVRKKFRVYWGEMKKIFAEYDEAYNLLFVQKQSPEKFIDFMKGAVAKYWKLGSMISSVDHSVAIWDIFISSLYNKKFKHEQLYNLFEMQNNILSKIQESA